MAEKMLFDDSNFREFMVAAKLHTYASGGVTKAKVLPNGGKRYEFTNERWPQWKYEDEWHGAGPLNNPFFGCELYSERTNASDFWIPVARMSYDGCAHGDEEQIKRTLAFLKKALQKVSMISPLRGPTTGYQKDDLIYSCTYHYIGQRDSFRVHGGEHIAPLESPLYIRTLWYQLDFQFCCLR